MIGSKKSTNGLFESTPAGQLALKEFFPDGNVPVNFELYNLETKEFAMKISGAEFRAAKAGPRKGRRCILQKETIKVAYIPTSVLKAACQSNNNKE